jgi:hypothetical protein
MIEKGLFITRQPDIIISSFVSFSNVVSHRIEICFKIELLATLCPITLQLAFCNWAHLSSQSDKHRCPPGSEVAFSYSRTFRPLFFILVNFSIPSWPFSPCTIHDNEWFKMSNENEIKIKEWKIKSIHRYARNAGDGSVIERRNDKKKEENSW